MSQLLTRLQRVSDDELVSEIEQLARCERDATARLVAHLAELDARRLYLGAGFGSLFAYCTGALRLSEHAAYNRIEAARAARRFPVILDLCADGVVNLTAIRLLAPHLTRENHEALLASAAHKRRREVEELLASRFPQPAVPSSVRKLPSGIPPKTADVGRVLPPFASNEAPAEPAVVGPAAGGAGVVGPPAVGAAVDGFRAAASVPPARRAFVAPLASDLYRITFTANAKTRQKLRMAQDLLRHQLPDGSLAEIFDRALSALLAGLVKRKVAGTPRWQAGRPTAGSRHIPASVRRAVWLRDDGCCAFVAADGRRCAERGLLEFHHAQPYAAAGEATERNITLRCRPHNGHEARLYFGPTRSETSCAPGREGVAVR